MNSCKNCKKQTKNKNFCSMKCQLEFSVEIRTCVICKENKFKVKKSKKKLTCSVRCAKLLLKRTCLERYGVSHPSQLKSTKEKIKLKRLGGSYDNMVENQKQTLLEKYGNKNAFKIGSVQFKENLKKKYGNDAYNNRTKYLNTIKKRYGTTIHPNTLKSTLRRLKNNQFGFNSKQYKNFLNRNNITNISQLQETKDKKRIRKLHKFYNRLLTSNIYTTKIIPMFSDKEYIGVGYYKKYKFKCVICNSEFDDYLYSAHIPRCPTCYPITISTGHNEVYTYIKSLIPNEEVLLNDRKILNGLELDIYIPSKNLAIEYNSLYFHSELTGNKNKHYHLNKLEECKERKIQLLHIFDDEWYTKQDIVKKIIRFNLGILDNKRIFARKCTIKEIDSRSKREFLIENHLQGDDKSFVKLGAFYNDELVALMTFSKYRLAMGGYNKRDEYELSRFAFNQSVTGIASKLLTHFINAYKPIKIITYSDKRYFTGKTYEKIGFNFVGYSSPGYWYTKTYTFREHRFNYRKNVLSKKLNKFDPNLTEWENMQLNGYDRIWDCGHMKFEMVLVNNDKN